MAERKTTAGKAKKAKPGSATGSPRKAAPRGAASRAGGLDKSVEQFRKSLERSVTLSRDRVHEVLEDAVKRGRITRGDAEKLLTDLLNLGRKPTDALLRELERLVRQARKEVRGRAQPARTQATQAARRARKKLG